VGGPAIAGFAIAWIGAGWCFFLNGLSFFAVILALMAMRIQPQERKPSRIAIAKLLKDFGLP